MKLRSLASTNTNDNEFVNVATLSKPRHIEIWKSFKCIFNWL